MVLNNIYRKKLLNAILYFAGSVKKPSKLKIFKLLYFLDFEHFKETGKSVTNLDYYALDWGPVPCDLYSSLNNDTLPQDFSNDLALVPFESEGDGKKGAMFKAKSKSNMRVFSPREQRIMEKLVFIFDEADAKTMSESSHLPNHPWDRTRKTLGANKKIDYLLAVDKESPFSLEEAEEFLKERQEMIENFGLKKESGK